MHAVMCQNWVGIDAGTSYDTDSGFSSSYGTEITTGIRLGMRPANERRRYNVTTSLIGWAHT